jgi:hypothetical protein
LKAEAWFVPADLSEAQVYLATLRDGKAVNPQLLLNNETAAAYIPAGNGRILFVQNENLYSQKLDRSARKLSGDPELLREHVASFAGVRNANFLCRVTAQLPGAAEPPCFLRRRSLTGRETG